MKEKDEFLTGREKTDDRVQMTDDGKKQKTENAR